jgi:DNA-binding NarL/FixJ family response regulator
MKPLSVVVAQRTSQISDSLSKSLNHHFRVITKATTLNDLMQAIPSQTADAAIVDLEVFGLNDVNQIHSRFPGLTIVCTHRLPDEKMWTQALTAGASDCCYSSDVRAIVQAASSIRPMTRAHAA